MQGSDSPFTELSDDDLVTTIKQLAQRERIATADLVAALAEMDARRLYLAAGCSSLFTYCTRVLHLSEHAAYGRIEAARAARRFPCLLEMLGTGDITLTTVGLLAPHLTTENHRALLAAARHKTKREVECQVAALCPRADAPASIRKIPSTTAVRVTATAASPLLTSEASSSSVAIATETASAISSKQDLGPLATLPTPPHVRLPPAPPSIVAPLAPERYRVQVTLNGEAVAKLRRAQDLLRHAIPNGDPAAIFDRALTLLLAHLERTKLALTDAPRPSRPARVRSRHIPSAVRRAVWARDEGRCAFVGSEGRCTERGFLEFHHVVPYAAGGEATVDTIALRCRRHNGYEAELEFGVAPPQGEERHAPRSGLGPDRVGPWVG